jgi:hypothetical protein
LLLNVLWNVENFKFVMRVVGEGKVVVDLRRRRGTWGEARREEGFEAFGVDVEVALVAAEVELAAKVQAHVVDVALALEGAVAVRVQGAERVAGEQGAGRVQVERAVGAVVRVRRLQEQLEGKGVERSLKHRSHMKSRFA